MSTLVTGISTLVTNAPDGAAAPAPLAAVAEADLGILTDAAIAVVDGRVAWTGPAGRAPACDRGVDLGGAVVLPGFVDSHTHAIFAGDRSGEFVARMAGQPYTGGGIATTVAATRAADDAELLARLDALAAEMLAQGTTTIEVKTGYGLDVATEVRLAALAAQRTDEVTYLGAHVVPAGADRRDYLDLVTGSMLAAVAPHARWIDVFCEPASPHAFDGEEAREVLLAGAAAGLGLRVHGNQLSFGPGVALAVELGAAAVDHCTYLGDDDVDALAGSWSGVAPGTVATLLPGVEYSTRHPYPDAQRLRSAGAVLALATDCNPGTCYSTSMPWVVALAVRECGMSIEQALWSATAGGALALRRADVGHLGVGALTHLAVVEAPSYDHLAYRPGVPLVRGLRVG